MTICQQIFYFVSADKFPGKQTGYTPCSAHLWSWEGSLLEQFWELRLVWTYIWKPLLGIDWYKKWRVSEINKNLNPYCLRRLSIFLDLASILVIMASALSINSSVPAITFSPFSFLTSTLLSPLPSSPPYCQLPNTQIVGTWELTLSGKWWNQKNHTKLHRLDLVGSTRKEWVSAF